MVYGKMSAKMKKRIKERISNEPLSLKEIVEEFDLKEKKAFSLLRSMFNKGEVLSIKAEDGQRKYKTADE